jgi:hypothetical protein
MFLCTLEKGIFWLILEGQIIDPKRKIKKKIHFVYFFWQILGFLSKYSELMNEI